MAKRTGPDAPPLHPLVFAAVLLGPGGVSLNTDFEAFLACAWNEFLDAGGQPRDAAAHLFDLDLNALAHTYTWCAGVLPWPY